MLIVVYQEELQDWNKGGDQYYGDINQVLVEVGQEQYKQFGQGDQD